MTPYLQMYHHQPPEHHGDCWRTAIGCLLDLPPDSVPHFYHDFCGSKLADARARQWLRGRGLTLIQFFFDGKMKLDELLIAMRETNGDVYYILSGQSVRGLDHAVIAFGSLLVHDPGAELEQPPRLFGPCSDGNWVVEFIGKDCE